MRHPTALVATLVIVVLAAVGAGVGVVTVLGDEGPRRMGPGWMAPASGQVGEAEYLAEMVAHHHEAVLAAEELTRSDRVEMRTFGRSIVETQSAEIRQMQTWLAEWYPDRRASIDYHPMMRDLAALSGDELDRVFLQDMIGHHMAAVMMSQHLLWRGTEHEEVAALARTIRDDQRAEIVQMRRWLTRWFGADVRGGIGGHMGGGYMGMGQWMRVPGCS